MPEKPPITPRARMCFILESTIVLMTAIEVDDDPDLQSRRNSIMSLIRRHLKELDAGRYGRSLE
jgi:hypothetical protein